MWEYSLLVLTVLISSVSLYRKLKDYKKVDDLNKINLLKLKKYGVTKIVSDEKRMTYIFVAIIASTIMLLWLKDSSGFHFVKCIAIFLMLNAIAELILSRQKYSLQYNANAFAYRGGYFKFKDIKAVGFSKLFFQPSKLYLKSGQSYICFKKGCDTIHLSLAQKLNPGLAKS